MSKKIILAGGGGHCKSCIDVIETMGKYEIYGIIDIAEKVGHKVLNYKVIGTDADIPRYAEQGFSFLITAGHVKENFLRKKLFQIISSVNGKLETIKANAAYVSRYAEIGRGTIIMHNAIVNAKVKIGDNCIINSGALLEHDTVIANHVHVSTMAAINGGCIIGENSFIGSNSVIVQGVSISSECTIGAGTVVHKNILTKGIYAGNPFKKINTR